MEQPDDIDDLENARMPDVGIERYPSRNSPRGTVEQLFYGVCVEQQDDGR